MIHQAEARECAARCLYAAVAADAPYTLDAESAERKRRVWRALTTAYHNMPPNAGYTAADLYYAATVLMSLC